jgi:hypothetical protein
MHHSDFVVAVSGEPHQFVFVAIVRKTKILVHRLVEDDERASNNTRPSSDKEVFWPLPPRRRSGFYVSFN